MPPFQWHVRVPAAIRPFVEGSHCEPVHIGKSAASVFRVRTRAGTLFLKTCAAADADGLQAEVERLRWLAGRLPVPDVVSFAKDDDGEYLLLTSLPGLNGIEAGRERPADVTIGLAQALKKLHAHPVAGCPFDQTVTAQIERARRRVAARSVDEADFDEERIGRTAPELLGEVDAGRPADEACALTHGDPCLPNVMFDEARFAGFIDCGRAGVADPYQDLALAARSIGSNLGREWVPVFFSEYGLRVPDERKLAFYRLLDEFF
jgi:aminoglycoside 3'-phosphotransferase II